MKSGCCSICLEPLFRDIHVSVCGHGFHRDCIYKWIDINSSCPNCKEHLDATELFPLYLEPIEIVKEVFDDPSVLANVDSELLCKLSANKTDDEQQSEEEDNDLLIIDGNKNKNQKKNTKVLLTLERIQSAKYKTEKETLGKQLSDCQETIRMLEDSKSDLNRKIHKYLKSAQHYEAKYFEKERECADLTIDLFKKNKELNAKQSEIENLLRQQQFITHSDNILVGNYEAVAAIEEQIDTTKSLEEQVKHYKNMYFWFKKEHKRSQKEKEKEKESHGIQTKQCYQIIEQQQFRMKELEKTEQFQKKKLQKYKEQYAKLKERYIANRKKYKALSSNSNNNNIQVMNRLSLDNNKHNNQTLTAAEIEDEEEENEEEDEDDDIVVIANDELNNARLGGGNVFSYPSVSGTSDLIGFGKRGRTSNSLFGAYHEMKSRKDLESNQKNRNPFSANERKRSFAQFVKGNDGRGGTANFLTESTNFHNNANKIKKPKAKKRKVVVSSSANNNSNKGIVKYFKNI